MGNKVDNQTMKMTVDATQVTSSIKDLTRNTNQWEKALEKALETLNKLAASNLGATVRMDVRGDPKGTEIEQMLPKGFRLRASRRMPTPQEAQDQARQAQASAEEAARIARQKADAAQEAYNKKARQAAEWAERSEAREKAREDKAARAAERRAAKAEDAARKAEEKAEKARKKAEDAAEKVRKKAEDAAEKVEEKKKQGLIKALEAQHGIGGGGGRSGLLPAMGRYGTLRAIDTGIRQGTAALTGLVTGGGENLGAGLFSLLGAVGNTIHRYGMTRYAVGRGGGGPGGPGGPGGGGGGLFGGGGPPGGGGGGGAGIGMAARGLMGGIGGGMAVAGSVIGAVAAAGLALHNKGAELRSAATDHAFAFNRAVGAGFGSGFDRGGFLPGARVSGISQRTSNELESFYQARQYMYSTLAKSQYGSMNRSEVDTRLGELTSAYGTRFSKLYKGANAQDIFGALTRTLVTGHDYGISAGTQGAYMRESLSALSGRGGGDLKEVLASQRWGINTDQYLQQGMALRASAAEAGVSLNRTQMGDFALSLQRSGIDMTQAFNVPKHLLGAGISAAGALTNPYGDMAQSGLMAHALSKTGSYEDSIEYLRKMSMQERVEALKSTLGETATRRSLMAAGISKEQASNLMSGKSAAGWKPEELEKVTEAMTGLETFRAQREAAQQPYESSQEREERMMRIDKLFDSIAAKMASFTDNLTKAWPF